MLGTARVRGAALAVILLGGVAAGSLAAADEPVSQRRPRLALVLSGGGARGAAHIGALRVIEELRIVPDLLVGTSMGSIVGGLYAAGWSPDEIENLLTELDWGAVFSDTVERRDRPFRRKLDDERLFIQGRLHVAGGKPYLPAGVLGGQRLELLLDSLEMVSAAPGDFDALPVPYRAVAVDLATGEPVVIGSGRLSRAMRASMAIPGMFPPVERDGRMLSDGGAVANLPVRIARSLGAEAVIAVDITSPLVREGRTFEDFWSVFSRMNSMLTSANRVEDVTALGLGDVYIRPELGDIGFLDFVRAGEAVSIGEAAARAEVSSLRQFSSGQQVWDEYQVRRRPQEREKVVVHGVALENSSGVDDRVVHSHLAAETDRALDLAALRDSIMRLKALDTFGTIGSRVVKRGAQNQLVLTTPPPSYGRDSLQVGLYLEDNLRGLTEYGLYFRHLVKPVNRSGAEVATTIDLGEPLAFSSELYQPLDPRQRWYLSPGLEARRELWEFFAEGEELGGFRLKRWQGRLDLGRVLGNWGDVAIRAYSGSVHGSPSSGLAFLFESFREQVGGVQVRFRVDTRDRTVLPREGTWIRAVYDRGLEGAGAQQPLRRWSVAAERAFSWGENTIAPYLELGDNLEDRITLANAFFLGGLGRLSGFARDELFGKRMALGRVLYYRRVARLDLASLRVRAFAGTSLEAGNVLAAGQALTARSMIVSGGPFVGAVTPIGPIFLGYGIAEGGRDHIYVIIGQRR